MLNQEVTEMNYKRKISREMEAYDILSEIDMEKACYLLNVDDMLEEMLSRRLVTHGYF